MATDPINTLLEGIQDRLKLLQDTDKVRILVRAKDSQPVSPGELQIVYVGSNPTETFDGSVEQVADVELFLCTQSLTGPTGSYAIIPEIRRLLADFDAFGRGYPIDRGDSKVFTDDTQTVLIFLLKFSFPIPSY